MEGLSISPFSHCTEVDQGGGLGEEETEDQTGAPERDTDVTVQEREIADLQIRDPGEEGGVSLCEGYGGCFVEVCVIDWNWVYRGSRCRRRRLSFWASLFSVTGGFGSWYVNARRDVKRGPGTMTTHIMTWIEKS